MRATTLAPLPPFGHALQLCLLAPFLLLVVGFLVNTPGPCSPSPPVLLPFASTANLLPVTDEELYVSVLPDGMLYVDRKWYPADEFAKRMREFGVRAPHKRLLLRAHKDLPFSVVRSVLVTLQRAGFQRVSLVTFEGSPLALISHSAA